ncbi:MAG: acyl-CoA dehydrogenase family protein [Proteobacteria bacterium]|nr:acyl-CoA dehydrogenase family protein [Pseudomonadota bacterium]
MDFRYSDEQLGLQETLQRFIARDYTFEQRRTFMQGAHGYSEAAWQQYAELGLLGLPLPEQYGGLGGSATDVMVVMEQFGRALMLEPYLTCVVLCGGLLRDLASPAQCAQVLPGVCEGKTKLALAAHESRGGYDLAAIATVAQRERSGWVVSGRKHVVLDAPGADLFLVAARTAGSPGDESGISLFLVAKDAAGLVMEPYATQSGSRAADLAFERVTLPAQALIGTAGAALPAIERAVDEACAALCAEALGAAAALNEATLAYLKSRKQFGVPIGMFQALQHRMADMYVAEEQLRSMAIVAAAHAREADAAVRTRTVAAAKAYVGGAARFIGQQAVQLHGGMGVVDEHIVSHYFKRLSMIEMSFGDSDHFLARFSDSLLAASS